MAFILYGLVRKYHFTGDWIDRNDSVYAMTGETVKILYLDNYT